MYPGEKENTNFISNHSSQDIEDAKAIISKEATGPIATKSDAHQIEDLQRQV